MLVALCSRCICRTRMYTCCQKFSLKLHKGWPEELTFCTHFSNQGVGVTKIERAWSLFEATLHHEIADLMWSVGSQVDIHLCLERLDDWRFLGSEEQIAWFRAVPSIRFPCVVHANYLPMYHCLVMLNNWYYLSIKIFTVLGVVEQMKYRPLATKFRTWNALV